MKIFMAGGEGLTLQRQKALFEAGTTKRLVSFFAGKSIERVMKAKEEFENENSTTAEKATDTLSQV